MAVRENKIFIPNEIYFITFTILGWRNVFTSDKYYDLVYKWFDYMKDNYNNQIHGYVIMPNHLHLLIKISDRSPIISKLIQNAKRFLAYDIVRVLENDKKFNLLRFFEENANIKKGAKHKVFEDRYDSLIIQSRKFFLEKLNYIHNNPCKEKWRLAERAEDYKHSSAANYISNRGYYEVAIMDF